MTHFRHIWILFFWFVFAHVQAHGPIKPDIEFIKNQGQWHGNVQYQADLHGGTLFLEDNRLTFMFSDKNSLHPSTTSESSDAKGKSKQRKKEEGNKPAPDLTVRGHVYRVSWPGSRSGVVKKEANPFKHNYNYFKGNDPKQWASKVPAFEEVVYTDLYPGIDFKIYSQGSILKSDYIIRAGVDPGKLRIRYEGVDSLFIDEHGDLVIKTSINTVTEHRPYAYQIIDGKEVHVPCTYALENDQLYFEFPEAYRSDIELIIDPTLVFSTYSGSPADNWGASATHDSRGNMFLGGIALGANYPTTLGAFQTVFGGGGGFSVETDVVIAKFSQDGTTKLFSTFLGGSSNDVLSSLFCSPQDEIIALITTGSVNFPVSADGFDRTFNGGQSIAFFSGSVNFPGGTDIAIVKLNIDGTGLVGSTYFGGRLNDGANNSNALLFNYGDESRGDIALDRAGNIYIVSNTRSTDIPNTIGRAQTRSGGDMDGVIASFSPNLSQLRWATYVGGSRDDAIYGIEIDRAGNIFVCGGTNSLNLPGMQLGLHPNYRGGFADGYVIRLDSDGAFFTGGTYIGTTAYDQAFMIELDRSGDVYLFGQTLGSYPTTNGVFSVPNAKQFIHKLNNDLRVTAFSTTFGSPTSGSINISPTSFLVDVCENIYAVGWGGSTNNGFQPLAGFTRNMPVTNDAFQRTTDGSDFYLINLSKDATNLIYATYFGEDNNRGDHVDGGTSRFDKFGVVYQAVCASCGGTQGFPTTFGVHSRRNGSGNCNMAGLKFRFDLQAMLLIDAAADPPYGCLPFTTQFNYTSTQPARSYRWTFGDGRSSTQQFPQHTYNAPGTYRVKLIIEDPQNCNPIDSIEFTIDVFEFLSTETVVDLCEGQQFQYENRTFDRTGIYILDSLQGSFGCDSLIILDLTMHPNFSIDTILSFCGFEEFEAGGRVFTQPGNYQLVLQTEFGCDSLINLTLIDSPVPEPSIEGERMFCPGDSSVLEVISSPAGRIRWSVGSDQPLLTVTNQGVYTVTVTTEFGCTGTASAQIQHHPVPTARAGDTQNLDCVILEVTLGEQPEFNGNYTWTGPGINDSNRSLPFPEVTEEGWYFLVLENEFGCKARDSVLITYSRTFPFPELNVRPPCLGEENGVIEVLRTRGGTAPYSYTIANTRFTNVPSGPFSDLAPGTYNLFVIDAQGCTSETSVSIPVASPIEIDLIKEVILRQGSSYHIKPEVTLPPGVTIERIEWTPPTWLSCTTCLDPVSTPDDSILYKITIIDSYGCMTMDSIYIRVFKPANIFIPSAFTPNRDGINDVFMIFADPSVKGINEFKIFDRWGELVHERYDFQPNDPLFGWDGKFRGQEMNPAVFVYHVVAELFVGETVVLNGDVTLVR